jgi:hypothetical protein
MALAILPGANVSVRAGHTTGGSFRHLPLCTHPGERGCVIAYSSFPGEPPAFSLFGRPGLGVSGLSGEVAHPDTEIACVNPAAIAGGSAHVHPYFPSSSTQLDVGTPWVTLPDTYAARCRTSGRATWLEVTPLVAGDPRAQLTQDLGAVWGFHTVDVNLALGDLVRDVRMVAR